jgi:hypothetical protein
MAQDFAANARHDLDYGWIPGARAYTPFRPPVFILMPNNLFDDCDDDEQARQAIWDFHNRETT